MLRRSPQKVAAEVPVSRGTESRLDAPEVPAAIHGRGVVVPKARVQIMPEVSGRAVYVHSQLHGGGVIRANEKILQIDPSSYELAVRRARAVADEAQARLDLERAAGDMRRQQGQPSDVERQADLPLFVREPQVRQAEATLESTKTELMRAELELSRTSIALPYRRADRRPDDEPGAVRGYGAISSRSPTARTYSRSRCRFGTRIWPGWMPGAV